MVANFWIYALRLCGSGWPCVLGNSKTILSKLQFMKKADKRLTRKMVNDALRARGRDESLREGEGYFYFGGGEAVNWLSSTAMVRKISDLTLDQWLKEFDRLLEADKKLRKMKSANGKKGAPEDS